MGSVTTRLEKLESKARARGANNGQYCTQHPAPPIFNIYGIGNSKPQKPEQQDQICRICNKPFAPESVRKAPIINIFPVDANGKRCDKANKEM